MQNIEAIMITNFEICSVHGVVSAKKTLLLTINHTPIQKKIGSMRDETK
ncbi:MAG: hypothetical protein WC608_03285 [Parcubacteria group bacterium]